MTETLETEESASNLPLSEVNLSIVSGSIDLQISEDAISDMPFSSLYIQNPNIPAAFDEREVSLIDHQIKDYNIASISYQIIKAEPLLFSNEKNTYLPT